MEEDVSNIHYYRVFGGNIRLPPGVIPHRFLCQPDRLMTPPRTERTSSYVRARKSMVADLLECSKSKPDQSEEVREIN